MADLNPCYICGAQPVVRQWGPNSTTPEPFDIWVCPNSPVFGDDGHHTCANSAIYLSEGGWNEVNVSVFLTLPGTIGGATLTFTEPMDPLSFTPSPDYEGTIRADERKRVIDDINETARRHPWISTHTLDFIIAAIRKDNHDETGS